MSSILDINLEGVEELGTVPGGEYKLKILRAILKDKERDVDGEMVETQHLTVTLEIIDKPNAKVVSRTIMIPHGKESERQAKLRKLELIHFYEAFGVDYTTPGGVVIDNLVGLEAWAILAEEETPEWGAQNRVRRFIVPA